jgi:membrane protease YdiL (CAAX protease family)
MNVDPIVRHRKGSGPWPFFALAYGWSWLLWLPAALSGQPADSGWVVLLHYLGGIGPLLAGVSLTYVTQDRDRRRDFWRRLIDVRRIGIGWYAVVLLTAPVLAGLAALVDGVLGGIGAQPEAAGRFVDQPWAIVPFALFTLVFGPLPEEIGWRGYALDRLQARFGALTSSLLLGGAWALWHLPLFFVDGTYQSSLGIGSLSFWLFMAGMVPQTVLMTWVYNNTRRSTLSAVLFHFAVNAVGELVALSARAERWQFLLWVAAAAGVAAIWGARTLTRHPTGRSGREVRDR